MDTLCCNVEQGVAVRVVGDERHDGVILLDHWGVRQLFKVIRPGIYRIYRRKKSAIGSTWLCGGCPQPKCASRPPGKPSTAPSPPPSWKIVNAQWGKLSVKNWDCECSVKKVSWSDGYLSRTVPWVSHWYSWPRLPPCVNGGCRIQQYYYPLDIFLFLPQPTFGHQEPTRHK